MSHMRGIASTIVAILVAVSLLWSYSRSPAAPNAQGGTAVNRRSADPRSADQTFDFGTAYVGDIVSHTFSVRNTSDRPLKIANVGYNCSCLDRLDIEGREIPPGSSLDVPMRVQFSRESPDFNTKIRLITDADKAITLHMRGRIIDPLPTHVDFGDLRPGERPSRILYWRPVPGRTVTVRSVESESAIVDVSYSPAPDNIAVTRFTVTPHAGLPPGPFNTAIIVTPADGSVGAAIRIRVSGRVLRVVDFDRASISVGLVEPNARIDVALSLNRHSDAPIRDIKFHGLPSTLTAADGLGSFEDGHVRLPLRLTAPPESGAFMKTGAVVVSFADAQEVQLPFQIVGLVRPGSVP